MESIRTPKVDNVKILERFRSRNPAVGTLYLTTTHLIFVDGAGKRETWILHTHMSAIEKQALNAGGSPLQIRCKDFRCITFVIPRDRDCQDIFTSLQELSKPADIEKLYAFVFSSADGTEKSFGWDLYDVQSEYLRMGVPNQLWSLSNLNNKYELCDTYPRHLYVPNCASTPVILGSSKFRSRGRLPVLSYFHSKTQAAICRCSQPLSGFRARCLEDEQMLHCILKSNPNPKSEFMYVVDTRPKINAMANKAAGKGYENDNHYTDIKFQFLGIENIHVMRASLQKLLDVCELRNPSMSAFLQGLEASSWLKHIKAVIDTSVFIAEAVKNGKSVLVHCSDGWDRTAQTCSLASLMLDPYYRTIQGFQALIEKEWLSFGHKFTDRCGFLDTPDNKEVSPVFTQFVEAVWQLMMQYPCAFQFNERFLLTIHDHVYSCQFGTFIGNCEKDRLDLRLNERTYSLWGHLSIHMSEFLNPLYRKEYEVTHPTLSPNTGSQCFKFWKGMYHRYDVGLHPREQIADILSAAKDHTDSLEDHIILLEKRVTQICRMLGKSEDAIQKKLNGGLSMESLDNLRESMDNSITEKQEKSEKIPINGEFDIKPDENSKSKDIQDLIDIKSDNESGFDESSSQLSKSGHGDLTTTQTGIETGSLDSSMCSVGRDQLSLDLLVFEMNSVAIDWKSFRNVHNCSCASPFNSFTKKFHCWKCGEVFCMRCITKNIPLPGHSSRRPVPVCRPCYKEIRHSPSMEFPPTANQIAS
ncbi:myotubularin-related protein 6-like isoform X2 [Ostrea edulis]|uniref:myotubularin-related protein 6-like isoform X2 n=1 Tax=Ostrea edulis TaxID=37623 RepID=UPI0024AF00C3|nr:myotubularin-related protein 6-like isoform X2 [Ostrea edulis]